jgi:hypothetical protein
MNIRKLTLRNDAAMPLIAALPYAMAVTAIGEGAGFTYDPTSQLSAFSASKNYSTCREDESVRKFFGPSKSDTQKDD